MEEEGEEVYRLLADWWMNTVQALVDSAGHEKALEFLKPYQKNASTASALILIKELGLELGFYSSGYASKIATHFLHRSDDFESITYENGIISVVSDCPFKYGPVEICDVVCDFGSNEFVKVFAPDIDLIMTARLTAGDRECRWTTIPKSQTTPGMEPEFGDPLAMSAKRNLPKEMIDSFAIQYLAEFWVMATKALIDHAGGGVAFKIVEPYMIHSGISYGLRYRNEERDDRIEDLEKIIDCISSCGLALQMKCGPLKSSNDCSELTITECPFKDTPPEVCYQFESFCNGICQAIDPAYEFSYDRMMTKGDESCHWSVRKRRAGSMAKDENSISYEPAIELLKKRFVMGEIGEEEYLHKRRVLKE
jgi:hypothetical protein